MKDENLTDSQSNMSTKRLLWIIIMFYCKGIIWTQKNALEARPRVARQLTLESAVQGSCYPFHPGAIKFYKEKGVKVPF
jgi:hypothetical protein